MLHHRKQLLYIDDNPWHYQLMCETFKEQKAPFSLTRVSDFTAAKKMLSSRRFDLILSEAHPLGCDKDWLMQIKKQAPNSPLIILTSNNDNDSAVSFMKMGADDYLIKNRRTLKKLSQLLKPFLQKKPKKETLKPGGFQTLSKNLKSMADLINQTGENLMKKRHQFQQINVLEKEIDRLKETLKGWMPRN